MKHHDEVVVTLNKNGRLVDKEGYILTVRLDGLIDVRIFGSSRTRATFHRRQVQPTTTGARQ